MPGGRRHHRPLPHMSRGGTRQPWRPPTRRPQLETSCSSTSQRKRGRGYPLRSEGGERREGRREREREERVNERFARSAPRSQSLGARSCVLSSRVSPQVNQPYARCTGLSYCRTGTLTPASLLLGRIEKRLRIVHTCISSTILLLPYMYSSSLRSRGRTMKFESQRRGTRCRVVTNTLEHARLDRDVGRSSAQRRRGGPRGPA